MSNVCASWLRKHWDELDRIHMLTGSKFIQLTADFVRRFAELRDAMLIYTDPSAFDEHLAERLLEPASLFRHCHNVRRYVQSDRGHVQTDRGHVRNR